MATQVRRRVYELFEPTPHDRAGRLLNIFILGLIIANVAAVVLESVPDIQARHGSFFSVFEAFSVFVFTVEYLIRVWVCVEEADIRRPVVGRLRYMMTPLAIVDLLAILPFLLQVFFALDTRVLRVLRLFRVFKLSRHFSALEVLFKVIHNESRTLLAALFILMVLALLASAGMYAAERTVQPEAFGSIPKAMWWSIVTLTTVGYGDVVPVTSMGRFFSGVTVILGIGIAALPAGIIAGGLTHELQRRAEAFRAAADRAIEKGGSQQRVRHVLEVEREDLELDVDEAENVLEQEEARLGAVITECPHCGKPIRAARKD